MHYVCLPCRKLIKEPCIGRPSASRVLHLCDICSNDKHLHIVSGVELRYIIEQLEQIGPMESRVGLWVLVWFRVNGIKEYPWEGKIMEDRVGRWLVLDPLGLVRNVNKALCSTKGWVNKGEIPDVGEPSNLEIPVEEIPVISSRVRLTKKLGVEK